MQEKQKKKETEKNRENYKSYCKSSSRNWRIHDRASKSYKFSPMKGRGEGPNLLIIIAHLIVYEKRKI